MTWIHYSLLMFFFSTAFYLTLKKLQNKGIPNAINNLFTFVIASAFFTIWVIIRGIDVSINLYLLGFIALAVFLFSFLGSKVSLEAIKQSGNPGYSLAIQKAYPIYTVFASVMLFGSSITFKNVIAIIIVIAFIALVSYENKKNKAANSNWVKLSFLAALAFGSLALASKYILDQGVEPLVRMFWVQLFVSMMFVTDFMRKQNKAPDLKKYIQDKSNWFWFFLVGISQALFNLFMQYAFDITPNIGYVSIISTSSVAAITLLSAFLFKEKLDNRKLVGILGVTAGIVLLLI